MAGAGKEVIMELTQEQTTQIVFCGAGA